MSRIPTPATIDTAPAASRPMLEARQEANWRRAEHVLQSLVAKKAISRLSRLNRDCR